jgi:hypothetical protein
MTKSHRRLCERATAPDLTSVLDPLLGSSLRETNICEELKNLVKSCYELLGGIARIRVESGNDHIRICNAANMLTGAVWFDGS